MANPQRKRAQTSRMKATAVDMDALVCLDMQHRWQLVEETKSTRGPLVGCPRRVKLCMVCGSLKAETINWRGKVMAREYKTDPVYLANARLLSEEPNERRMEYRKRLIGKAPRNACTRCGLIHDSTDCPDLL